MKSTLGVDIGTYAIKLIELQKKGATFEVLKAASVPNSVNMVIPAQQKDRDTLTTQLKQIWKEFKLPMDHVRIGLPESVVSTKIIAIPPLSDAELASAIGWQAEQYIPIPSADLQLEYQVLYRPSKKQLAEQMRVLLIGVSKNVINAFHSLFVDAGLEVTGLETQMMALYRLALQDPSLPTTLFVHMGASTMDMCIVHEKELVFVYSHPNGGLILSRAVERELGLDPTQAEEYKRTYGLEANQLEGKVRQALLPTFKTLVSEIQKTMQYAGGLRPGLTVKRIVFSGGSAVLPDLIPTVAESIPVEIVVFSPFSSWTFASGLAVPQLDLPGYSVAAGLALGGLT